MQQNICDLSNSTSQLPMTFSDLNITHQIISKLSKYKMQETIP